MKEMEPVKNLTKENCFDALGEDSPDALAHFCKWIDEYKKEIGWNELFGPKIKFHHLPFEMQKGIIARYEFENINDRLGNAKEKYRSFAKNYRYALKDIFSEVQHRLLRSKPQTA
jgi:hypothetical protein